MEINLVFQIIIIIFMIYKNKKMGFYKNTVSGFSGKTKYASEVIQYSQDNRSFSHVYTVLDYTHNKNYPNLVNTHMYPLNFYEICDEYYIYLPFDDYYEEELIESVDVICKMAEKEEYSIAQNWSEDLMGVILKFKDSAQAYDFCEFLKNFNQ